MPDKVNWTVFRENRMGDHKLTYDEQISIFFISLTYKVLSAYVVNTLNNENFGPKPKNFEILFLACI